MIVDADRTGNACHTAAFNIGGTTSTSRSWNVLITQYACGDTDSSGYVFNIPKGQMKSECIYEIIDFAKYHQNF